MANIKDKNTTPAVEQEVAEKKSAEQFYVEHRKTFLTVAAVALLVVLGVLAYHKFIYKPAQEEAFRQMLQAEFNFRNGLFDQALNGDGDGNVLGFADIINEYGSKAGKAVYMYAGVCALQLEDYASALDYLKKYNGKDDILAARALACQGDAYVGLEDYTNAIKMYEAAIGRADNGFAAAYLVKEGLVYEKLGNNAKALECYLTVKDKYSDSIEGYEIDSYINGLTVENN